MRPTFSLATKETPARVILPALIAGAEERVAGAK
jgi:hypothetical protein